MSAPLQANDLVALYTIPFFSPSIQASHSRPLHTMQIYMLRVTPNPYRTYFPPPAPISSEENERVSPLPYLHRSHFSIYGPAVQMERLDIQIFDPPLQFSSVFRIDDRFGHGVERS
ncbi:hypothetical protein AVEN_4317-1 [Araneus ventricosus]|uniref:Uncharacterized protein n=1 Tax=Araneus ventricosus TaxID=182803 RepID=A0A4Y2GGE9_ARAVE|nr:hypothetical protein AVEN_4317-1 [Araneus ventricosus]